MILSFFTFIFPLITVAQLQSIGHWREHLPWKQTIRAVHTAGKVWAATPWSLFSADATDNMLERYSRMNGLTETGISAIAAVPGSGRLIIAYTSSNIDILDNGEVINISAIKNSTISGDKTVHSIFVQNNTAWFNTGLGIIVVDLDKYEVRDTYIIGNSGSKILVRASTADAQFFYAATAEGLKRAPLNNSNLADFRNWQSLSGANGLSTGPVEWVTTMNNMIVVQKNDSLLMLNGNSWDHFYTDGQAFKNLTVSANKILLSEEQNGAGRIVILTPDGTVEQIIQDAAYTAAPRQAIFFQNFFWIADSLQGLSKYSGGSFESYIPNSPLSLSTGQMQIFDQTLWVAAGGISPDYGPAGNKHGLYRFSNDTWSAIYAGNTAAFDSLNDIVTLVADPSNQSCWAGSFGGGLVNIGTGNALTIYKQNSPLLPAYFSPGSYRVSGLALDAEQNLWVTNYGAATEIHVRKPGGDWHSFAIPFPLAEKAVAQIVIDDLNQKWIVSPKNNGLICFNHGQTVDNPADDQWKWYRAGAGNGNLPDNRVLCIAKDKSNFIWVGTGRGIGIIYCPQLVFNSASGGCEAVLPVVQQDNFAGYLFRDEEVQAIAVDGADRKWIGTKNGVWLISADAEKTIWHFTESNSPLLHNDVQQIAIDGLTGEVFFATARGICSFRSNATEGTGANSNVLVFPNPVPPGYTGAIAIRGVAGNAIVKITEPDGRLVYQTRALGGQAIWNGKDYKGRTINTGVYLVLVSDDNRKENLVTKIVFIR